MNDNDTKRLSRLTSILTQLQTKRLLTARNLSEIFNVSVRTIYRDIRALEQAGVPIITEDGKGYSLMEGYKIPPLQFGKALLAIMPSIGIHTDNINLVVRLVAEC